RVFRRRGGWRYLSRARIREWPPIRFSMERKGADFLAVPHAGRRVVLGFHVLTTAPTGLLRERAIPSTSARLAVGAILLPYLPALPKCDAEMVRRLDAPQPVRSLYGAHVSTGWANFFWSVAFPARKPA